MDMRSDLVVFSHLRWDFVFQRPQQLLSRIARSRRVFFIEEPKQDMEAAPHWQFHEPMPGVTVCQPFTPILEPGFSTDQYPVLRDLLDELVEQQLRAAYDVWFYTPMALPVAERLKARKHIYDCMDELTAFDFAPAELISLEQALLRKADLVFTGGPSLYLKKKDSHANCHCFPSSVDASHFAGSAGAAEPDLQASIPHPRLGFYGVIDERFDVALLRSLADARPDWQFVMVGPVVKIDPATLPTNANIHYMGMQTYDALPGFLAGWDVALLPFARNRATRYISPTKTLEYMAAGKPIVSTPIHDVAEPYGHIVGLGDNAEEFLAACEKALNESNSDRVKRLEAYRNVLDRTSWDSTANAIVDLVDRDHALPLKSSDSMTGPRFVLDDATGAPVIVIGAGPTGLSAAYHLGDQAMLLEANDTVGGWCRSIEDGGFTFDYAGHIMFSKDPAVHQMYEVLLGSNVHWQDREAWIYSKDVFTRYPFQGALYGLPADVITECIMGAMEARFGKLDSKGENHAGGTNGLTASNGHAAPGGVPPAIGQTCKQTLDGDPKDASVSDCCGDGVLESTAELGQSKRGHKEGAGTSEPKNFEEFIYKVWGAGIAKHFAIPYNRKIWAVPLDEMETSWLGGRVPMPNIEEMIEGALSPKPAPMGPNARFGYPLKGGFQALMDGFLPVLKGPLRLNSRVKTISASEHRLTLTDGSEYSYQQLISTMPLPLLIKAIGLEVPEEVKVAATKLRHTSVKCVNIGVGRENLTDKHWIYYPEDTVFHRIFVQGNASPHCNPPGGFGLTCEITYGPLKPLPCDGEDLIRLCIEDCKRVGMIREDDPIWVANQVDMPHAYVVYDHARSTNVALIRDWLAGHDIHLAGRYSEWEYYNSDHAFLAGRNVADLVRPSIQQANSTPSRSLISK